MLSLAELTKMWNELQELVASGAFGEAESSPRGPIKKDWWNPKWIPFTHSGSGDHDCVDLDPAPGGHVGQIIEYSHEVGAMRVAAESFVDWLTTFASALEAGKYQFDQAELCLKPTRKRKVARSGKRRKA
jgi:cell wall assembly regulator SMI1